MDGNGISQLLQWAQRGQQQAAAPAPTNQYPVAGEGFAPTDAATWQGNQLQIPGLGGLLGIGVNGTVPTGGSPGGGTGGGGTGGGTGGIGGGSGNVPGGGNIPGGVYDYGKYVNAFPDILAEWKRVADQGFGSYIPANTWDANDNGVVDIDEYGNYHWNTFGVNSDRTKDFFNT